MRAELLPTAEDARQILIEERLERLEDLCTRLGRKVEQLEKDKKELEEKLHGVQELSKESFRELKSELIFDKKRITKLEDAPEAECKPNEKTQTHLESIFRLLAAKEANYRKDSYGKALLTQYKREGLLLSQISGILGLSSERVRQLAKLAAKDSRFNVCWHPKKKNSKIIRLSRWDAQYV